ncbi:MAG TPA: hypothetical protein PLC79_03725, partial [Phycisphaerae bacterium]|nr:hypothetical protein [Phycisphaerae bacterium]
MEAHGRNHSFPDDGRLTVEEAAFIERNRFYAVSIAKSLWSRDHRAFGLDDVIGVAYVAMLEAALAWRKLTGEPARDYRFIFFAGLRIKRACYAFVVSNERAFHRTADQVRRARKGQGTDASRVMLLGGGRASPLHLAGAQWGVRRGRTGRPLYRVAEDPPAEIQAGARQLLRAALIDAAAGCGGREAEA